MSRKRGREVDEMQNNTASATIQNGDHASCSREESPSFPVKFKIH